MRFIKNILFDLGGVIIDIDPQKSLEAFIRLAGNVEIPQVYQHQLFHRLESGQIEPDDFRREIKHALGLMIHDHEIDACMNAMLGEIPVERLKLLEKMKQRHRTALISNTNAIHYAGFTGYLQKTHGSESLDVYFHKTYYSHLVKIRKPDPRIFEMILQENNFNPQETLFLDDTEEHLNSAAKLGLQTIKVTPRYGIVDILKDF